MKKTVFFLSKRPSCLAKNWNFAWKNDKKLIKKVPKRAPSPAKKFCMTNWKSSYVRGFKWKIENRPGKLSEGYLTRVNLYKTGYLSPSKVLRFGTSRPESASKRSFRLTQSGLVPSGTRHYTNADPHAFCPRSGESAMYSMNSFTTSAIPLNCDKILRVSPWTFSAPQWQLRSLIKAKWAQHVQVRQKKQRYQEFYYCE